MSLLDEEFHWFFCGNEAEACCFGPFRDYGLCEHKADTDLCDHDHMIFISTGRRLVASLPPSAEYIYGSFYGGHGLTEIISGRLTDLRAVDKIELYDEMADLFEARNSSRSASIAS